MSRSFSIVCLCFAFLGCVLRLSAESSEIFGFPYRSVGDVEWVLEFGEGGMVLVAPVQLEADSSSEVEFWIEGPGMLEVSTFGSAGILRISADQESDSRVEMSELGFFDFYQSPNAIQGLSVELVAGLNRLRIAVHNPGDDLENLDLALVGLELEPGFLFTISGSNGGSVLGAPSERVAQGQIVEVQAVPDEGYEFYRWRGTVDSDSPTLKLLVDRLINLTPIFYKEIIDQEPYHKTGGEKVWEYIEGNWSSPGSLAQGEAAWIDLTVPGPSSISFDIEGNTSGNMVQINDGEPRRLISNRSIELYEEVNQVRIVSEGGDSYNPVSISNLTIWYPVELHVFGGLMQTNLSTGAPQFRFSQTLERGTELEVELFPTDENRFFRWDGDLSGAPERHSFVVDHPIVSSAWFESTQGEANGVQWKVDEGAYIDSTFIRPTGFSEETKVSFNIKEAGHFLLYPGDTVESFGFLLNGETVDLENGELIVYNDDSVLEVSIKWAQKSEVESGADPRFEFVSGFLVNLFARRGGRLEGAPEIAYIPKGTVLSVKALANANNHFVGWTGDRQQLGGTLSFTVDGPFTAVANFEADADGNGNQWRFEGVVPGFEILNPTTGDGTLYWEITEEDVGTVVLASFKFDGPGSERIIGSVTGAAEGAVTILVDGVEQQLMFGGPSYFEAYLEVGPGMHEVVYLIDPEIIIASEGFSEVEINNPYIENEFRVQISGKGTNLGDESLGYYAYGDRIQVVAPEVNEFGYQFSGWWRNFDKFYQDGNPPAGGEVISVERELDLVVNRRGSYTALYNPERLSEDNLYFYVGESALEFVENMLTPDGDPVYKAIVSSGDGNFRMAVDRTGIYKFWTKIDSEFDTGLNLVSAVHTPSTFYNHTTGEYGVGWHQCSIFLNKGEVLEFGTLAFSSGTEVYIGGVSFEAGWSPTILGVENVEILTGVKSSILKIEESRIDAFVKWDIAVTDQGNWSVVTEPLALDRIDNMHVKPRFNKIVESDIGEITAYPEELWTVTDSGAGKNLFWHFRRAEAGHLSVRVTGPKVVEFDSGIGEIRLDGERVSSLVEEGVSKIAVPQGEHSLSFFVDGSASMEFDLRGIKKGYLSSSTVTGGKTVWEGESLLEVGQKRMVEAVPSKGFRFVGWQFPYDGEGPEFECLIDESGLPVPEFEPLLESQEVRIAGIDWTTKNLYLDLENQENVGTEDWRFGSYRTTGYPAVFESVIEGPCVIYLQRLNDVSYRIDGEGIAYPDETSKWAEFKSKPFFLEEGNHTLSIEQQVDETLLYPNILVRVEQGYPVSFVWDGVQSLLTPDFAVYERDTEVLIAMTGITDAHELQWAGLPDDATFDGAWVRFTVNGPIEGRATRWTNLPSSDFDFKVAGDKYWSIRGGMPYQLLADWEDNQSLSLTVNGPGYLHFVYSLSMTTSPGEALLSQVVLNGETVSMKRYNDPYSQVEYWESVLKLSEGANLIYWNFIGLDRYWDGIDYTLSLNSLEFSESEELAIFPKWWFDHSLGSIFGLSDELHRDMDSDGINIIDEYRLGLDPYNPDTFLFFEESTTGLQLSLSLPAPAQSVEDRVTVYVTEEFGSASNWQNIRALLGEPHFGEGDSFEFMTWQLPTETKSFFARFLIEKGEVSREEMFGY